MEKVIEIKEEVKLPESDIVLEEGDKIKVLDEIFSASHLANTFYVGLKEYRENNPNESRQEIANAADIALKNALRRV